MVDTPVALIVFNRPDHTRRVLEQVRAVRPRQLFLIADGPRIGREDDESNCAAVRSLLESEIDWHCEVRRDFAMTNLGCARRVSSALDWVFGQVDKAIILEDDCLPDETFFPFFAELLEHYSPDSRIGAVGASNFQSKDVTIGQGYYFSRYPHCWGWATWKRAWQYYDHTMADWPTAKREGWLRTRFRSAREAKYWEQIFDRVADGKIDSWGYKWTYACWRHDFLTVLPATSLVENIGFGVSATNTFRSDPGSAMVRRQPIWPLKHPLKVERNVAADRYTYIHHYDPPLWVRAWRKLKAGVKGSRSLV